MQQRHRSGVDRLRALSREEQSEKLGVCCSARSWVEGMIRGLMDRPFLRRKQDLLALSEEVFDRLEDSDWLEAFAGHPRIGDLEALSQEGSWGERLPAHEQQAVAEASRLTLRELAEANRVYEDRFGYVFIVCATGKGAEEMLAILRQRLENPADQELRVASLEQRRITRLRLVRLIGEAAS